MTKVLWFTGLSGSGKTTISEKLKEVLESEGKTVDVLDGDVVRNTLHQNLGFSREDIKTNNHLISKLAKERLGKFDIILVPIISPYTEDRQAARELIGESFIEIFIDCPLEICINRDVKGLYKKALAGEMDPLIGMDDEHPYQPPINPEIHIKTEQNTLEKNVESILAKLV